LPKTNTQILPWKKGAQNLTISLIKKNLPKVNNRPKGENTSNLVTLVPAYAWLKVCLHEQQNLVARRHATHR
jgi:hypothetical protein